MIREYDLPPDAPEPCPMGCGGFTDDPAGGPCKKCWAAELAAAKSEIDADYEADNDTWIPLR